MKSISIKQVGGVPTIEDGLDVVFASGGDISFLPFIINPTNDTAKMGFMIKENSSDAAAFLFGVYSVQTPIFIQTVDGGTNWIRKSFSVS